MLVEEMLYNATGLGLGMASGVFHIPRGEPSLSNNDQQIWQGTLHIKGHKNEMVLPCVATRYPTLSQPRISDAQGWLAEIHFESSNLNLRANLSRFVSEPAIQWYVRFGPIDTKGKEISDPKLVEVVNLLVERNLAFEIKCEEGAMGHGTLLLWGLSMPLHGPSLIGVFLPKTVADMPHNNMADALAVTRQMGDSSRFQNFNDEDFNAAVAAILKGEASNPSAAMMHPLGGSNSTAVAEMMKSQVPTTLAQLQAIQALPQHDEFATSMTEDKLFEENPLRSDAANSVVDPTAMSGLMPPSPNASAPIPAVSMQNSVPVVAPGPKLQMGTPHADGAGVSNAAALGLGMEPEIPNVPSGGSAALNNEQEIEEME